VNFLAGLLYKRKNFLEKKIEKINLVETKKIKVSLAILQYLKNRQHNLASNNITQSMLCRSDVCRSCASLARLAGPPRNGVAPGSHSVTKL
jgi:succinate dehydrogenase/fumarate reductase-like Fe-S protein